MQLTEFLTKLQGVTGSGSQYTAICPAHHDKNPSLSIGESDGKTLLHCHTGCTTENILKAVGLDMKDLFVQSSHAANSKREMVMYKKGENGCRIPIRTLKCL